MTRLFEKMSFSWISDSVNKIGVFIAVMKT